MSLDPADDTVEALRDLRYETRLLREQGATYADLVHMTAVFEHALLRHATEIDRPTAHEHAAICAEALQA